MHPWRLCGAAAALIAAAACRPARPGEGPLLGIEAARSAPSGRSVRLHGELGLYDGLTRGGYLQDGPRGLFFEASAAALVPAPGARVEVEGVMERRSGATLLRAERFRIVSTEVGPEPQPTPEAPRVAAGGLGDPALEGAWVAAEGVVTGLDDHGTSHALHIEGDGASFVACMAEPRDRPIGRDNILGFRVRAQGVRVAAADVTASRAGCTLRLPARGFLRLLRDAPLAHPAQAPPLTPIEAIRALTPDEARRRRPVRVRGVVTAHDADRNLLFVQDETAGIYVEAWRHLYDLRPGQRVEVTGWTERGAFAPIVVWPRLEVLGNAPFPRPRRLEAAVAPQYDGQWIEVDGIVRAAQLGTRRAVLELTALGERVRVDVPGEVDPGWVGGLVDARIRLRGVYKAAFRSTRQLVGVEINVPRLDLVSVLAARPADPYGAPVRRSDTVLEFRPQQDTGHRIHVRGIVTLHRRGRFLYLRDAGGPLYVGSRDTTLLVPGDEVDVLGFPGIGEYRPVLLDASYRLRGRQDALPPRAVRAEQAMDGNLDGELISIEGRLLDQPASSGRSALVLQSPFFVFEAELPSAEEGAFASLRPGSRLRVTGISVVKGNAAQPQSLRILLRSAADVSVVQSAPWWTPRRAASAVVTLVAVAAGALVWVGALRRRVRAQTEVLRGRLAREATLEERTRLARELHDTLEQNLAGIGYALEAVKETLEHPNLARSHLGRALEHVDRSMAEARRSVWALRPHALEDGTLVSALEALAGEVTRAGVARVELRVYGAVWPLQRGVEDHLFRIGQEALTNALKHARADRLDIDLRFDPASVELAVEDGGRGFDASGPIGAGHSGLAGMRERAAQIGGRLEIASTPGRGTLVRAVVPRRTAALPEVG